MKDPKNSLKQPAKLNIQEMQMSRMNRKRKSNEVREIQFEDGAQLHESYQFMIPADLDKETYWAVEA